MFVSRLGRRLLWLLLAIVVISGSWCRARRKILSGKIRIFPSRYKGRGTRLFPGIVFRLRWLSGRVRYSLFPLISRGRRSRLLIKGSLRRITVRLSVMFGSLRVRLRIGGVKFPLLPLSGGRTFGRLIRIPNRRLTLLFWVDIVLLRLRTRVLPLILLITLLGRRWIMAR